MVGTSFADTLVTGALIVILSFLVNQLIAVQVLQNLENRIKFRQLDPSLCVSCQYNVLMRIADI